MVKIETTGVKSYLLGLQNNICKGLEKLDGKCQFSEDAWERDAGGGGITRTMIGGGVFEKAGVNFSHVKGEGLPASSSASRPDIAGSAFEAMGVSLVLHPHNPFVPTTHLNVRFFKAQHPKKDAVWWFGGGYDLTPYYPFPEDVIHWHQTAKSACDPFGGEYYDRFKKWCDIYFFLKHRNETRGVGGLFFDDFNEGGFEHSFGFMRAVGDSFLPAYSPIVERRQTKAYGDRERSFQLHRRGRYVEFNLIYDRGTLFGLQTGGRTESILMSLPPLVSWEYQRRHDPGSAEAGLQEYLKPRDWLGGL